MDIYGPMVPWTFERSKWIRELAGKHEALILLQTRQIKISMICKILPEIMKIGFFILHIIWYYMKQDRMQNIGKNKFGWTWVNHDGPSTFLDCWWVVYIGTSTVSLSKTKWLYSHLTGLAKANLHHLQRTPRARPNALDNRNKWKGWRPGTPELPKAESKGLKCLL